MDEDWSVVSGGRNTGTEASRAAWSPSRRLQQPKPNLFRLALPRFCCLRCIWAVLRCCRRQLSLQPAARGAANRSSHHRRHGATN
jgi:hypothetical protein